MISLKPCDKPEGQREGCIHCVGEPIYEKGNVCGRKYHCMAYTETWKSDRIDQEFVHTIVHACEEPKQESYAEMMIRKMTKEVEDREVDRVKIINKELLQKIAQMECSTFEQERVIANLKERNAVNVEKLHQIDQYNAAYLKQIDELQKEECDGGHKDCRENKKLKERISELEGKKVVWRIYGGRRYPEEVEKTCKTCLYETASPCLCSDRGCNFLSSIYNKWVPKEK